MASKRAQRRKQCDGKVKYDSRENAQTAASAANRHTGSEWIFPYHCEFCNQWHIGHADKKQRGIFRRRGLR